jgi:uncharacterized glyoxalase superfamily protein PhnB
MAKPVPEGMHTVTVQLSVDGAAQAIDFYKKAFGAEEIHRAPDPSGQKIWHAQLRIGSSMIFVNDHFPDMGGHKTQATLWLYLENVDAAFKRAVDAGAQTVMPVADMFWGDRIGTVSDKWGIRWSIATHVKDMTPAEMQKAQDEFVKSMPKK